MEQLQQKSLHLEVFGRDFWDKLSSFTFSTLLWGWLLWDSNQALQLSEGCSSHCELRDVCSYRIGTVERERTDTGSFPCSFDHTECLGAHLASTESGETLNIKGSCHSPKTGRISHKRQQAPSLRTESAPQLTEESFHKTLPHFYFIYFVLFIFILGTNNLRIKLFLITGYFFRLQPVFLTNRNNMLTRWL